MRRVPIGRSGLEGSAVALGCMRIDGLQTSELADLLCTAVDVGIDTFDHADIYVDGRCETAFGDALRLAGISREAILIETKAGIRSGFLDLSADHLVASVDRSLGRLRTDYLCSCCTDLMRSSSPRRSPWPSTGCTRRAR